MEKTSRTILLERLWFRRWGILDSTPRASWRRAATRTCLQSSTTASSPTKSRRGWRRPWWGKKRRSLHPATPFLLHHALLDQRVQCSRNTGCHRRQLSPTTTAPSSASRSSCPGRPHPLEREMFWKICSDLWWWTQKSSSLTVSPLPRMFSFFFSLAMRNEEWWFEIRNGVYSVSVVSCTLHE